MKARQRRAARRRSIRQRYPILTRIWADTEPNGMFGEWFVYGYKGQSLKVRRQGMSSGYTATLRELGQ